MNHGRKLRLRLTQIAPGVYRLSNVYTNWYLLESDGRLTVLDAGLPGDWRDFLAALSRLGHSRDDVDAVLITHHHRDHAVNAEPLRASGARVFSHPADAPYLRGEEHFSDRGVVRYVWPPWYASYLLSYLAKGILRTPPVARLHELDDGDVVDVPGSPRVIHAPATRPGAARCSTSGDRSCSRETRS